MPQIFDSIVIGAGVSGITASIYLKRANLNVLILEKEYIGGQTVKTSIIENYPGIKSIVGSDFAFKLKEQVDYLNIPYKLENVIDIKDLGDIKEVITTSNTYKTKTVLIATGRIPKTLGLKNESKFIGKGLSYCAVCDGFFYKDRNVAIVGGGNSAFEAALYLKNICHHVTIINRSSSVRADKSLIEASDVDILYNTKVVELLESNGVLSSILLSDGKVLPVDGLFIYIGMKPVLPFVKNLPLETFNDYIVVNDKMETNIRGIYASGDIIDKEMYQIITSASEGAIAANQIKKYIALNN